MPICRECGNDDGPYHGLCLDCLETLHPDSDPPGDPMTTFLSDTATTTPLGIDPNVLVTEFHTTYDAPIADGPASLNSERVGLRVGLIAEEFSELLAAIYGHLAADNAAQAVQESIDTFGGHPANGDIVETADALADLVYVIYGMALELGIDLPAVLTEVHRSNMSKLGEDGRPIVREDGKVLKGPNYTPPNIAAVLDTPRLPAAGAILSRDVPEPATV